MKKTIIETALKNAVFNGYDFTGMSAREIAEDLVTCDSVIEAWDISEVEQIVEELRNPKSTGFIADTPESIRLVQYTTIKSALKLEKTGLRIRRGPKLRKPWAIKLGMKQNATYDEVIAKLEEVIKEMSQNPASQIKAL